MTAQTAKVRADKEQDRDDTRESGTIHFHINNKKYQTQEVVGTLGKSILIF